MLALEREMGTTHPHVGKAWLALSRAYQKMASPAHNKRAERALVRCDELCSAFLLLHGWWCPLRA